LRVPQRVLLWTLQSVLIVSCFPAASTAATAICGWSDQLQPPATVHMRFTFPPHDDGHLLDICLLRGVIGGNLWGKEFLVNKKSYCFAARRRNSRRARIDR
jgi:hypothetical protein